MMRILLRNGRVFEGSPIDIVAGMRARAEAFHLSISAYASDVARDLLRFEGVDIGVEGRDARVDAERLIDGMLRHGFAVEERLNLS